MSLFDDVRWPVISLVTDLSRFGSGQEAGDRLVKLVSEACVAGIDIIQIRENDLSDRELVSLVGKVVAISQKTETKVLVNDRVDIAITAGATGVHLKGGSHSAARVRRMAPAGWLIGRSVHGLEEANHVSDEGAVDYVTFGPVFETDSKPGITPHGLTMLKRVVSAVEKPVLAIGGITVEKAGDVASSGVAGISAISLFSGRGEKEKPYALENLVGCIRTSFDRGRLAV